MSIRGFLRLSMAAYCVAVMGSAYAQTTIHVSFPACMLTITTDANGMILPQGNASIEATSGAAWTPADGCKEMFAAALDIQHSAEKPSPPIQERLPQEGVAADGVLDLQGENQASAVANSTERNDSSSVIEVVTSAVEEKKVLVDLLEKAAKAAALPVQQESTPRLQLVTVVETRIRELERTIENAPKPSDSERAHQFQDLKAQNERLTMKGDAALRTLKNLQEKEQKARTERDILQQWLVAVVVTGSLLFGVALLTWLGLAITRRMVLSKDRPEIHNPDRQWLRESLEEHQWLARRTRFFSYAIPSLIVLSAVAVLANVMMSGESIIEPIKGGAVLATLVAVLGVQKTASAWRNDLQDRILKLVEIDARLAKQP